MADNGEETKPESDPKLPETPTKPQDEKETPAGKTSMDKTISSCSTGEKKEPKKVQENQEAAGQNKGIFSLNLHPRSSSFQVESLKSSSNVLIAGLLGGDKKVQFCSLFFAIFWSFLGLLPNRSKEKVRLAIDFMGLSHYSPQLRGHIPPKHGI